MVANQVKAWAAWLAFLVFVCPFTLLAGQTDSSNAASAALSQAVAPLAASLADRAGDVGCHPSKCKVLVTSFLFLEGGGTSPFGIQLADALAAQLAVGEKHFTVIDRNAFREKARQEKLSAGSQGSVYNFRSIAEDMKAGGVILGKIIQVQPNLVEIVVTFAGTDEKSKAFQIKGQLHLATAAFDFSRTDDLQADSPTVQADPQPNPHPSCTYMPAPPYTDEALKKRISGRILLQATVGADGRLVDLKIIKGLPAGLNESALKTVATWQCKPLMKDGQPVSSTTTFELNFSR
jgi:TonB family protein